MLMMSGSVPDETSINFNEESDSFGAIVGSLPTSKKSLVRRAEKLTYKVNKIEASIMFNK